MNEKEKYMLEDVCESRSSQVLWNSVSSPLGLKEWFADDVKLSEGGFVFEWDGVEQAADVVYVRNKQAIRFRWKDEPVGTYFEFKISSNEMTKQLSLTVCDFAAVGELEDSKRLWDTQIEALRRYTGM